MMEGVDSIARRYGQLPSKVLRVTDELKGLSIDLWAHNWGAQRESFEAEMQIRKLKGSSRGR